MSEPQHTAPETDDATEATDDATAEGTDSRVEELEARVADLEARNEALAEELEQQRLIGKQIAAAVDATESENRAVRS